MPGTHMFRRYLEFGAGKTIANIAGINMQMIMPHILAACRFVVLPQGDPVALVNCFHGEGDLFGARVNVRAERNGKIIDVFVMRIGNNQHVPGIVGRIMQAHESGYRVILKYEKGISAVRNFTDDPAEGTVIVFSSMIVHGSIFLQWQCYSALSHDQFLLQW